MFKSYQTKMVPLYKEHGELTAAQSRMLNWIVGLAGETGEVAEVIVGRSRGGPGEQACEQQEGE